MFKRRLRRNRSAVRAAVFERLGIDMNERAITALIIREKSKESDKLEEDRKKKSKKHNKKIEIKNAAGKFEGTGKRKKCDQNEYDY